MELDTTNIISFVARESKSGKTTLIEGLIKELKQRNIKISVIKHSKYSSEVQVDKEGKDSWRFVQSGADRVMLFTDQFLYMYENKPAEINHIISLASQDAGIVIIEGFKEGPFKKIEVFRKGNNTTPLSVERPDKNFIAIVSDTKIDCSIPCFSFDDIKGITDFLMGYISKH